MEDILYKLEWIYEEATEEEKSIIITFLRSYIYHYFKDDIGLFLNDLALGDKEFITKSFIINNQKLIMKSKVIDINEAYKIVTRVVEKYITMFHIISSKEIINRLTIKKSIHVKYHNDLENIDSEEFIILINPSDFLIEEAINKNIFIICFSNNTMNYKGKVITIKENDLNLISKTINCIIDNSIGSPLIGMDYIDIINMMKRYNDAKVYFSNGNTIKDAISKLLPVSSKGYCVFTKGNNTLTLKELEEGIEVLNSRDILYGGIIDNTILDREVMLIELN